MSNNRTGKGGNYEQARNSITNEIMNANGNINTLIQNGVLDDYATPYTKKQVQGFLRSEKVQIPKLFHLMLIIDIIMMVVLVTQKRQKKL